MGTPTLVCVRSCLKFSAPAGRPFRFKVKSTSSPTLLLTFSSIIFRNQNGNVVNENVQENVRNVLENGNQVGFSYKEFLTCNPKEYDEFYPSHEMTKLETELWNHVMVEAGHAAYTDRFYELARLVPHLVTPKSRKIQRYVYGLAPQIHGMVAATEPKTIQKAVQIFGALTDKTVSNGLIMKVEKRGNVEESSKDKNGRDDNRRTRTGNALLLRQTM
nr:reverse transcriptase domain-containing protein [Tanacetum cinerariifolium]